MTMTSSAPAGSSPATASRSGRSRHRRSRWAAAAVIAGLVAGAFAALAVGPAPSASAAPLLCGAQESTRIDGGRYIVQNNVWGASTRQCIDVQGTGFEVTTAEHANSTSGIPAAYPSVYAGCHYANCTTNSGLPLRVSDFGDVRGTYRIDTPDSGEWNASFDLWFDPTQRTDGQNTGAELMIWADHRGAPQPIGQKTTTVTLEGAVWDVWIGNIGWNVISYVRQQPTADMRNFSIRSFVDDAANRGQIDRNWYMTSVQAGFEPWVGGVGLAVREFSFTTAGGGGTPAPSPSPTSSPSPAGGGAVTGFGGLCLDVAGAEVRDGAAVIVWDCHGEANQQWTEGTDGTLRAYDRCLSAPDGAANGTRVTVAACTGAAGQAWSAGTGGTLVNSGNGRCLDVASATAVRGAEVQVYDCRGDGTVQANQAWQLP